MPSPPQSSAEEVAGDMFFSSPHHGSTDRPEDEVLLQVAKAQIKRKLSPTLSAFLSEPSKRSLFLNTVRRQIQLLKSRSQVLEDAQVTVYDKALLTLTRNGNELENPAAVEFFCAEYLGMKQGGPPGVQEKILQQSVILPALLNQAISPPTSNRRSMSSGAPHPTVEASPAGSSNKVEVCNPRIKNEKSSEEHHTATSLKPLMEPKLARLWSVYEKARADFVAISNKPTDSMRISNAARFLRDTAENTLEYLKNKNTDPIMIAELNATYNMAKSMAVSLTGGKKRKFDVAEMNEIRGTPRGPSNLSRKATKYGEYDGAYGGCGGRGGRRIMTLSTEGPERHPGGSRNGNVGRGHSGIPYGYSRQVDSYQPY